MTGDDAGALLAAAVRLRELADRTTAGDWRAGGLLASRPEVVAHAPDGGTEHVADARARSGAWIAALSPAVAEPLAAWLTSAATAGTPDPAAVALARVLLGRLPGGRPPPWDDECPAGGPAGHSRRTRGQTGSAQ